MAPKRTLSLPRSDSDEFIKSRQRITHGTSSTTSASPSASAHASRGSSSNGSPPLKKIKLSSSPGRLKTEAASPHRVTQGEKAREKKLRDDPMAVVLTPQLVECCRCGGKIKLSVKSAYDLCHWRKHRERCLKRSATVPKRNSEDAESPETSGQESGSTAKSPLRQDDSPTPPLTPDSSANTSSELLIEGEQEQGPPSPTHDHTPVVLIREPNPAFEAYLQLTARRPTREVPIDTNWQSWSWAQLKEPQWAGRDESRLPPRSFLLTACTPSPRPPSSAGSEDS